MKASGPKERSMGTEKRSDRMVPFVTKGFGAMDSQSEIEPSDRTIKPLLTALFTVAKAT